MANDESMRVYRVAKLLGVSKKRIYQMVVEGKLEAKRLGPRNMRITRASVDRFMDERNKRQDEFVGEWPIRPCA